MRTAQAPVIDGRLSEESWVHAVAVGNFTQRDPEEGKPATERTEIRFLYDDTALYVGVRLFDSAPRLISQRLSMRDGDIDADAVTIYLDPKHDRLTGAVFTVTAANVQHDSILHNDTWTDRNWDAVWQSQTSVDADGWTAEIRIPLSQLRFTNSATQIWGVNVERFIRRKNERSWLVMVPKDKAGLASRMLDLVGLDGLRPGRHLELLPYTAGRAEFIGTGADGNPFNDGSRGFASAGIDLKWGLTTNLTVDGTINPDFGQVEVDPAVVNLTAFETFFPEKRAFFLEGSQIFHNFGQGGANDFWGFNNADPSIFYSRRIGRAPQITASGDFVDAPTATTILGAAKLTGKTRGNWSLGFLEAVTDREQARTQGPGAVRGRTDVEPLTNYAVARVQRDIGQRAGTGFIVTTVNRRLDTAPLKAALPDQAYVFGSDGFIFLDDKRDWVLTGKIAGSHVAGSPEAIQQLQEAPQRYYQRPDAPEVSFDPTRTSLSGLTGRINLNRNSGLLKLNAAFWGVSPGFESNDLGFHTTGDRAGAHAVVIWRNVTPGRFMRSRSLTSAKFWSWNFNRELQSDGWISRMNLEMLNYSEIGATLGLFREVNDDRLTRGGPSALGPKGGFWNLDAHTDSRRWFSLSGTYNNDWNQFGSSYRRGELSVTLKPSPRLTISTAPSWSRRIAAAQYVTSSVDATATATHGGRYVFGNLDERQASLITRVAAVLTPRVSVQVYMQPLLAAGGYSHLKELARPRTFDFVEYGGPLRPLSLDGSRYTVTPDVERGAPAFTFDDPDFNVKSLKINAVFRWELKPGSTVYAVWTRQQQDSANPGRFAFGRDARALFGARGDDVFLVKMAYWIGR